MKFLEAKQLQAASANRMLPQHANKMLPAHDSKAESRPPVDNRRVRKLKADVRALADELGVDCALIRGTGKDGAITALDVRTAAIGQRPLPNVLQSVAPEAITGNATTQAGGSTLVVTSEATNAPSVDSETAGHARVDESPSGSDQSEKARL